MNNSVLVVGGGIAGVQVSIDLAERGFSLSYSEGEGNSPSLLRA